MAVVNSLNYQCPFIPLLTKPKNPNFNSLKFNPNQASRFCFPSRRCVIVNGTLLNSHRNTPEEDDEVDNLGVKAALSMLKFYKREISPVIPKSCRFVPSCSEYSMEAYKKYGVVKGTVLTAWRLCRCNPLGGSGFDPPRWFDEEKPTEE
ncbi:hypothetical protein ES319_D12G248400v1 [Gossypium barbadense]|uniref:Membrane protein insertion efficiency factor n=1 Tax=Gossypium barbadense TaxID=3634 RepID=A0A5J5P2P5_GOSBA|nr:hypothetical protein ES319_D12G248400v1 [Gossypium barbadense]KAB2000673.1 hypothetical protein ES319_D12G248400v1 [Gossypium barbadense]